MARTLVTESAGWLGAAVVRQLAARGDQVIALDNFQAGAPANLEGMGPNVQLIAGDITDLSGLLFVIEKYGLQRIVHTAAIVSVISCPEAPSHVTRVNIDGTVNVLEANAALRPRTHPPYLLRGDLRGLPLRAS